MNNLKQDQYWMQQALNQAKQAYQKEEVPVGAILVLNDKIIARSHNTTIHTLDPTAHAEINVLRKACRKQQNYRLPNSVLYTTLEPCLMCTGAIIHARIKRIVFATHDPKFGAIESMLCCLNYKWNHKVQYSCGCLQQESQQLLKSFFKTRR